MNKFTALCLFVFAFVSLTTTAQKKFIPYTAINGVEFSTRWTHEKWYSKKSPEIFSVKVKNTNHQAMGYEFGVDFFLNGMLVEENEPARHCLKPGKKAQGKLNGIYFKSEKITGKERDSGAFSFELTDIIVEPVIQCEPHKKTE